MSEAFTPLAVYRALQRHARSEGYGFQNHLVLPARPFPFLSAVRYRNHFVLKSGLLLPVLDEPSPTADAGVNFDASSARNITVREHVAYPFTRIVVPAALSTDRLQPRLDMICGDLAKAKVIVRP